MAVARPQITGGLTGLKVALIVFVVVAVASLTFTIIFYTQQSELVAAAQEAQSQAGRARETAGQAKADLRAVATEVLGEPTDDLAQIKETISRDKATVLDNPRVQAANIPPDSSLLTVLTELYALFTETAQELEDTASERDDLRDSRDAIRDTAEQRDQAFKSEIADLNQRYETLVEESTAFRNEKNDEIDRLKDEWAKERTAITEELRQERTAREKAQGDLAAQKQQNAQLLAQLAAFKPSGERGSILQIKDGSIVRSFAGDDIVYVDLGQRDGVKPGMTFSVYSATGGIPADGKGKAAIQVANVFDTTSECRVTVKTPGEPILRGDAIANPIFDKYRQFQFAVTGNFDLDFDGKIEDPGGQEVARLITRWGGKVMDQVDTRTDFVVLGAPPPEPAEVPPEEMTDADRQRASELEKSRQAFEAVAKQARALSIPILTRTRFLYFLGYGVPKHVPDDQPPS